MRVVENWRHVFSDGDVSVRSCLFRARMDFWTLQIKEFDGNASGGVPHADWVVQWRGGWGLIWVGHGEFAWRH